MYEVWDKERIVYISNSYEKALEYYAYWRHLRQWYLEIKYYEIIRVLDVPLVCTAINRYGWWRDWKLKIK